MVKQKDEILTHTSRHSSSISSSSSNTKKAVISNVSLKNIITTATTASTMDTTTTKNNSNVYLQRSCNGSTRTKTGSQQMLEYLMNEEGPKLISKKEESKIGESSKCNKMKNIKEVTSTAITTTNDHWSKRLVDKASKVVAVCNNHDDYSSILENSSNGNGADSSNIFLDVPKKRKEKTTLVEKKNLKRKEGKLGIAVGTDSYNNHHHKSKIIHGRIPNTTTTTTATRSSEAFHDNHSNFTGKKPELVELSAGGKVMDNHNGNVDKPLAVTSLLLWSSTCNNNTKNAAGLKRHRIPTHVPQQQQQQKHTFENNISNTNDDQPIVRPNKKQNNQIATAARTTDPIPRIDENISSAPMTNCTTAIATLDSTMITTTTALTTITQKPHFLNNPRFSHIIHNNNNNNKASSTNNGLDTFQSLSSTAAADKNYKINKKTKHINENYVRLNLRNSSGTSHQRRHRTKRTNTTISTKQQRPETENFEDENSSNLQYRQKSSTSRSMCITSNVLIDPLDDYLDGTFDPNCGKVNAGVKEQQKQQRSSSTLTTNKMNDIVAVDQGHPKCIRHGRTCQLLTVRKGNTGNRGRKFYVCSLPRGEQCNFFQWQEDTAQAARKKMLQGTSISSFIARQVASHAARYKLLTLPELRKEAKIHGLRHTGKKQEIVTRLLVWVRDEVSKSTITNRLDEDDDDAEVSAESTSAHLPLQQLSCDADPDTKSSKSRAVDDSEEDSITSELSATVEKDDSNVNCISEGAMKAELARVGYEIEGGDHGYICLTDDDDDECTDSTSHCSSESGLCSIDQDIDETTKSYPTVGLSQDKNSNLLEVLFSVFGYRTFRPGQEWAIQRCLNQKQSLLVAPTGFGKSLCYALPALMLDGLTIVVSPLISLMQDQLRQLPPRIPAASLSGSMSFSEIIAIIDDVVRNRIKILFVSPERLASAAFRRLFRGKHKSGGKCVKSVPKVSLLCIDECHCLSTWGHNFRPSYLRIKSLLPLINPTSVLALTATACVKVITDVCNTLGISYSDKDVDKHINAKGIEINTDQERNLNESGIKVLNVSRKNIDVSACFVASDEARRSILLAVLKNPATQEKDTMAERKNRSFSPDNLDDEISPGCLSSGSVIVYVWRQRDAESLAEQLNGAGVEGGVVFYHGGLEQGQRQRAQGQFMRGKARICVATVAFGMGINKSDVRGVIHMCLPQSPENFVQEIGRAGRDGRPAKAICLIVQGEVPIRHSLAHSDGISASQIKAFILLLHEKALQANENTLESLTSIDSTERSQIDVALPMASTVKTLDCKEESIETMISILEEHKHLGSPVISLEGYLSDSAVITLKRRTLQDLSRQELVARCIMKCGMELDQSSKPDVSVENAESFGQSLNRDIGRASGFHAYSFGSWRFSVVSCARLLGRYAEPRNVFASLRRLQDVGELELSLETGKTGRAMHLKLHHLAAHVFGESESCSVDIPRRKDSLACYNSQLTSSLYDRLSRQEGLSAKKVEHIYSILHQVSISESSTNDPVESNDEKNSDSSNRCFHLLIDQYFSQIDESRDQVFVAPVLHPILDGHDRRKIQELTADILILIHEPTLSTNQVGLTFGSKDCIDYTARAITKILHAIDAPRAPVFAWNTHPLWGKWRTYCFKDVYNTVFSILEEKTNFSR